MLVVGVLSVMTKHPVRESIVQRVEIQAQEIPNEIKICRGSNQAAS
jgi:hypothetical protein